MSTQIETTWRVTEVVEKPELLVAELVRTEWFKPNPAYGEMMAEYDSLVETMGQEAADALVDERDKDKEFIEQFLDARPGEEDARFIEATGKLTLDITDQDIEMHAGDDVIVSVSVVETVDA
jgi:hypothetical protein